jgi:hypothetical protein
MKKRRDKQRNEGRGVRSIDTRNTSWFGFALDGIEKRFFAP